MRSPLVILVVIAAAVVTFGGATGCGTSGRRTIGPAVPAGDGRPGVPARGSVWVTAVEDRREFQNDPPNPSTPSVEGDVRDLTPDERARMIGRQRNKYGRAQGDVALPAGDSVHRQARLLVEAAFRRRGYEIADDPGAASATVAVTIDRFWAWCVPAYFFTVFEARVRCTLTVTRDGDADGRTRTVTGTGRGHNPGRRFSDENWRQTYERAYADFLDDLVGRL